MRRISLAIKAPYVGLRPFFEEDALLFFGRKRNEAELLAKLTQGTRFVAVLGASGTGKSSLVRAGLVPALHRGAGSVPSSRRWNVVTLKPGNTPLANLASRLAGLGSVLGDFGSPQAHDYIAARLESGARGIVDLFLETQAHHPDEALLIFVDQFEEIFRYRQKDINEADTFVKLLLRAASEPDAPIYVVVTMRADFLGQAVAFERLAQAINDGLYLAPPLDTSELTSVVVSPLRMVGGDIAPALVAQLLNDLGGEDDLPVLEHALLRMWNRARDGGRSRIEMDDYREVCRVRDAAGGETPDLPQARLRASIDNHATELFESLSPHEQKVARSVFVALVDRADGKDVRREQELGNLLRHVGPSNADACMEVLRTYRADGVGFLLPASNEALKDSTPIDIAHESLIRQWSLFQDWLATESAEVTELKLWHGRAVKHDHEGGGWLDELDCGEALRWKAAVLQRGNAPEWAARYLPTAVDPLGKVFAYVADSEQRLVAAADAIRGLEEDARLARERQLTAESERLRTVAVVEAASLKKVRRMASLLAAALIVTFGFALWALKSKREADVHAASAAKAARTAADSKSAAEKERAIAQEQRDNARQAEAKASRASQAHLEAAAKAESKSQEAERGKVESGAAAIWHPLMLLGQVKETTSVDDALLRLARAEEPIKRGFLEQAFSNPMLTERFNEQPGAVLHAAVGLSPKMRGWLLDSVDAWQRKPALSADVGRALSVTKAYLTKPVAEAVLLEIRSSDKQERTRRLGGLLADALSRCTLGGSLVHAKALSDEAMATSDTERRRALVEGFSAAVKCVSAPEALPAAREVVRLIRALPPRSELSPLKAGLAAMAKHLTPEQGRELLDEILLGVQSTDNVDQRRMLLDAAVQLAAEHGDDAQILKTIDFVRRLIKQSSGFSFEARNDAPMLAKIAKRASPSTVDGLAASLTEDLKLTRDAEQAQAFVTGLDVVASLRGRGVACTAAREALGRLLGNSDARQTATMAKVLSVHTRHCDPAAVDAMSNEVISQLLDSGEGEKSRLLGAALVALVPHVSDASFGGRIAAGLLKTLDTSAKSKEASAWADALGNVRLPAHEAAEVADVLLSRLVREQDSDTTRTAAKALGGLAASVDQATSAAVLARLLDRLEATDATLDDEVLLETTMAFVPKGVKADTARRTVEAVLDTAKTFKTSTTLPSWLWTQQLHSLPTSYDDDAPGPVGSLPFTTVTFGNARSAYRALSASIALLPLREQSEVLDRTLSDLLLPGSRNYSHIVLLRAALLSTVKQPGMSRTPSTLDTLLAAQRTGSEPYQASVLSKAVNVWARAAVSSRSVSAATVSKLVAAMEASSDLMWVGPTGEGLSMVAAAVADSDVPSSADHLLAALKRATNPERSKTFTSALVLLAARLPAAQVAGFSRRLLQAATESEHALQVAAFGRVASATAKHAADADESTRLILEFLKYPSVAHRDLADAVRMHRADVPPYDNGVSAFVSAVRKTRSISGDLDAPARYSPVRVRVVAPQN
jgi:hypothetical protein